MEFELAALAYLADMKFGEFPCKHPVVFIGEFISEFEQRFYRNRILSGALLVISLLVLTLLISVTLAYLCGFFPAWLSLLFSFVCIDRFGNDYAACKCCSIAHHGTP